MTFAEYRQLRSQKATPQADPPPREEPKGIHPGAGSFEDERKSGTIVLHAPYIPITSFQTRLHPNDLYAKVLLDPGKFRTIVISP